MYMTLTPTNQQTLLSMAKRIKVKGSKEFVKDQGWTSNDEEQCVTDELEGKALKKTKKIKRQWLSLSMASRCKKSMRSKRMMRRRHRSERREVKRHWHHHPMLLINLCPMCKYVLGVFFLSKISYLHIWFALLPVYFAMVSQYLGVHPLKALNRRTFYTDRRWVKRLILLVIAEMFIQKKITK